MEEKDRIVDVESEVIDEKKVDNNSNCLLYTSPSPRDTR